MKKVKYSQAQKALNTLGLKHVIHCGRNVIIPVGEEINPFNIIYPSDLGFEIIPDRSLDVNKGKCELGFEIENIRISKGLTQKEYCRFVGISDNAYRSIILGKTTPHQKTIRNLRAVKNIAIYKTKGKKDLSQRRRATEGER